MIGVHPKHLRDDEETPIYRPTPEMVLDAIRRNSADRSITAWLMGDPPPGCSALDKRGMEKAANNITLAGAAP